jgi:hypothetical protein
LKIEGSLGLYKKLAVGLAMTLLVAVNTSEHPRLLTTVKVTLYVFWLAYVCEGFCWVELPWSPKSHVHCAMLPVETVEFSLNWVGSPKHASTLEKLAIGFGFSVTELVGL